VPAGESNDLIHMRILLHFILFFITVVSSAQSVQQESNRFQTYNQNESWLTATKALDKEGQWAAVKQRFFMTENQNVARDSVQYAPMMVINGVPFDISSSLTDATCKEISSLLHENSIEALTILDSSVTEKTIFCRIVPGVIILRVDKKTVRKLFRLKLR
jgi:hypothetical protein